MIYLNDYERGGVWINKFHIIYIDQLLRDCKLVLIDGSIYYTLQTDAEIIAKIQNYDL